MLEEMNYSIVSYSTKDKFLDRRQENQLINELTEIP
jgi:hypothetical protein